MKTKAPKGSQFNFVLVTAPDLKTARRIATACLDKHLAACVNLFPGIESHYLWKGAREKAREILLLIKTRKGQISALQKLVLELHPYEVPEFVVLKITGGSEPYLRWILDETC